jgi:hypothetical protein
MRLQSSDIGLEFAGLDERVRLAFGDLRALLLHIVHFGMRGEKDVAVQKRCAFERAAIILDNVG